MFNNYSKNWNLPITEQVVYSYSPNFPIQLLDETTRKFCTTPLVAEIFLIKKGPYQINIYDR